VCQKRLKLSRKVDKCKPLVLGFTPAVFTPAHQQEQSKSDEYFLDSGNHVSFFLEEQAFGQGLTLVQFPAQPEPFLTQNAPKTSPETY
jgi:hypothetical protein